MAVGPSRISTLTFTTDLSPYGVPVIEDRFYRVHRFREGRMQIAPPPTITDAHYRALQKIGEYPASGGVTLPWAGFDALSGLASRPETR